jgi:hypothetical protein
MAKPSTSKPTTQTITEVVASFKATIHDEWGATEN